MARRFLGLSSAVIATAAASNDPVSLSNNHVPAASTTVLAEQNEKPKSAASAVTTITGRTDNTENKHERSFTPRLRGTFAKMLQQQKNMWERMLQEQGAPSAPTRSTQTATTTTLTTTIPLFIMLKNAGLPSKWDGDKNEKPVREIFADLLFQIYFFCFLFLTIFNSRSLGMGYVYTNNIVFFPICNFLEAL